MIAGDSTYNYYHTVLGISDLSHESMLSVYPNPSSGKITMRTSGTGILAVCDLYGKEMLHQEISEPNTTIDIASLPGGLYLLKLSGNQGLKVCKFIKK